jgi:ABC-2 type transport system ATP-binding protein
MHVNVAELRGVTKHYGPVAALRGIDLEIGRGELVALLGPNGAGKTTAVRILLGLAQADSGTATVFGHPPGSHEAKLRRGALLQVAKVPETLKVREHIELFSSYYKNPLPSRETVAAAGLGGIENRLFGELSGGQKQRLLFALASVAIPTCCFWMSRPSGSTWRRGAACGAASANSSRAAAACC